MAGVLCQQWDHLTVIAGTFQLARERLDHLVKGILQVVQNQTQRAALDSSLKATAIELWCQDLHLHY